MKTKFFTLCISVLAIGCFLCGCNDEIKKDALDKYIYVNNSSLNVYIGDEVQLKASPPNLVFQWSSDNESVATVSQSGVVTAVSEGIATISVAWENEKTDVEVKVRTFVPLTDINLIEESVKLFPGDKVQITTSPVPIDASENIFIWTSANQDVATVDKSGLIKAIAKGITTVTVKSGNIEKAIIVNVPELYQCDKVGSGGTVTVSDAHTEGGGKDKIIDGDYANHWILAFHV